jgi:hypothetical protein
MRGIVEEKTLRKLTEEEKQKIIFVANDLFLEDLPEEPTEYDVLMKQKAEEFTSGLLEDDESSTIESLLKICEEYINNTSFSALGLIMMYDMWLNKSSVWPVMYNPEWEEWDKLIEKKVGKVPGT